MKFCFPTNFHPTHPLICCQSGSGSLDPAPCVMRWVPPELRQTHHAPNNARPQYHHPLTCALKQTWALLRRVHHCRNCGKLTQPLEIPPVTPQTCTAYQHTCCKPIEGTCVCDTCSQVRWPDRSLPPSYRRGKKGLSRKKVRICVSCDRSFLTVASSLTCRLTHYSDRRNASEFRAACLAGDMNQVRALYSGGNINLRSPFPHDGGRAYPVHCAAMGGSVELLYYLAVTKHVDCKVLTKDGLGPLQLAAGGMHVPAMVISQSLTYPCSAPPSHRHCLKSVGPLQTKSRGL